MRVAVVNLTGGGLSGGYRKYLQNILPLMANDERVTALEVYMPADHADVSKSRALTLHRIPADNLQNNKSWLKNELAKHQFDVVFIPSAIWINCTQTPIVTMLQNMEPLVVPFQGNPFKECVKNIGRYVAIFCACRRARRVIAISEFVRAYLTEKWRIKSERVGLVYHGIEHTTLPQADDRGVIGLLKSFPFLFTAGSIRPARGLEDIIRALGIVKTEKPIHLVIGGNVDPGMELYFNKLKTLAKESGISERIHWTGKLDDASMSWYFKNCEAFVMTSRVESFGMIASEAMVHGCVCISSDSPCLPEIFGSSALYYPSQDFAALARQIQSVISMGRAVRTAMTDSAKNVVSRFSWAVCARKTVDELQRAALG